MMADFGRPWRTHEAFQIIFKEQVKAFIRLGAKPELPVCFTYNACLFDFCNDRNTTSLVY